MRSEFRVSHMTVFFHDCRFYSKTSLDVSSRREMQLHLSILCALWELEMDLQRACEKYRVLETRRQKHLSSETVFETPTHKQQQFHHQHFWPLVGVLWWHSPTFVPRPHFCILVPLLSWPRFSVISLFHHNSTFMSEFLVYLMTPFWGHDCTALPHFCITTLPWDHNPTSG